MYIDSGAKTLWSLNFHDWKNLKEKENLEKFWTTTVNNFLNHSSANVSDRNLGNFHGDYNFS